MRLAQRQGTPNLITCQMVRRRITTSALPTTPLHHRMSIRSAKPDPPLQLSSSCLRDAGAECPQIFRVSQGALVLETPSIRLGSSCRTAAGRPTSSGLHNSQVSEDTEIPPSIRFKEQDFLLSFQVECYLYFHLKRKRFH